MKTRLALALVGAAIVAAAVAWLVWPSGGSVKTLAPIGFGYSVHDTNSSASLLTLISTGKPIPPVAPLFASLRAKRTPADTPPALPRMMLAHLSVLGTAPGPGNAPGVSSAMLRRLAREGPGAVKLEQSHLLLTSGGRSVYAAPTTHGAVCFVLSPGFVTECVRELSDRLVWLSLMQTPTGTVAVGLVPDRVTKLELAIGTHRRTATLTRNAFLYDAASVRATEITALVLTAGGKRFLLPLDRREFKRAP